MKQSILFEQGKLYVLELPRLKDFESQEAYHEAYVAAIANKVEVKNPEELPFKYVADLTKDGDTFTLPDGIEVDIWYMAGNKCEMAFLKRIEPEKSIARRLLGETPQDVRDKVRQDASAFLQSKKELIEPEKPEETQEVTLEEFLSDIPPLYHKQETFVYTNLKLRGYTIQRKKS